MDCIHTRDGIRIPACIHIDTRHTQAYIHTRGIHTRDRILIQIYTVLGCIHRMQNSTLEDQVVHILEKQCRATI